MMTSLLPLFVELSHKLERGNGFPYTVNLFQGRPKRLLCKGIAIPTERLFFFLTGFLIDETTAKTMACQQNMHLIM